jgi:hypothetical protein
MDRYSGACARPESGNRIATLGRLAAWSALTDLQDELKAYGVCDLVKVEAMRRAEVLVREAALRHADKDNTRHLHMVRLMRIVDNYSILMSHLTRQHNVEPQDIRCYFEVGID